MENKPIISFCGDTHWAEEIERYCLTNLPMEPTDWVRTRGHTQRTVHVDVNFEPFNKDNLPSQRTDMVGKPVAHIYITTNNQDDYRTDFKEKIGQWLGYLRSRQIQDWLIIVVSPEPIKKTKFLQRNTLVDKIKSDFNVKNPDKYLVCIPSRAGTERRAYAEAWTNLLSGVRRLLLDAYDQILADYEDNIRTLREARFDKGWNYFEYFALQEELAGIYESLCLFDDALIQYDELEAVFSQCVEGYRKGERQEWLVSLASLPCTRLDSVVLSHYSDPVKRRQVRARCVCLFDFRAYLLSRQCALLQLLGRTGELTARALPTIMGTLQEAKVMQMDMDEVEISEGLLSSWVFLCSLQVVQTCLRLAESDGPGCKEYAELWRLSCSKLGELGRMCGLWPDQETSSKHLQDVINLRAAMQHLDADESQCVGDTPYHRLGLALSSKDHFKRIYLEMNELCLGIIKHIGRMRAARMMACDLADFYVLVGEHTKAEALYRDALKMYKRENWPHLASHIRVKMANCQKLQDTGKERYLKSCLHLSSCGGGPRSASDPRPVPLSCEALLPEIDRLHYWREAWSSLDLIRKGQGVEGKEVIYLPCAPMLRVDEVVLMDRGCNGRMVVRVGLQSFAPESMRPSRVWLGCSPPVAEEEVGGDKAGGSIARSARRSGSLMGSRGSLESGGRMLTDTESLLTSPSKSVQLKVSPSIGSGSMEGKSLRSINSRTQSTAQGPGVRVLRRPGGGVRIECSGTDRQLLWRPSLASLPRGRPGEEQASRTLLPAETKLICDPGWEIHFGKNEMLFTAETCGFFIPHQLCVEFCDGSLCLVDSSFNALLGPQWVDPNVMDSLLPAVELEGDSITRPLLLGFDETLQLRVCTKELTLPKGTRLELLASETAESEDWIDLEDDIPPHSCLSLSRPLKLTANSTEDEFSVRVHFWRLVNLKLDFVQPFQFSGSVVGPRERPYIRVTIDCNLQWDEVFSLASASLHCRTGQETEGFQLSLVDPTLATGSLCCRWRYSLLWSVPRPMVNVLWSTSGASQVDVSFHLRCELRRGASYQPCAILTHDFTLDVPQAWILRSYTDVKQVDPLQATHPLVAQLS